MRVSSCYKANDKADIASNAGHNKYDLSHSFVLFVFPIIIKVIGKILRRITPIPYTIHSVLKFRFPIKNIFNAVSTLYS